MIKKTLTIFILLFSFSQNLYPHDTILAKEIQIAAGYWKINQLNEATQQFLNHLNMGEVRTEYQSLVYFWFADTLLQAHLINDCKQTVSATKRLAVLPPHHLH